MLHLDWNKKQPLYCEIFLFDNIVLSLVTVICLNSEANVPNGTFYDRKNGNQYEYLA